jgi:hypothetical protein
MLPKPGSVRCRIQARDVRCIAGFLFKEQDKVQVPGYKVQVLKFVLPDQTQPAQT